MDKKWGDWLHKSLESYQVPASLNVIKSNRSKELSSKLTPIFRDSEELPTRSDLSKAIINALKESKYLIVICSPSSAKSQWVNKEITDFKKINGEDKVLALIVDGEPNATEKLERFKPEMEAFPEALKYRVDSVGNLTDKRIEPLAADAREIGDGKERAKIKLIAGLLGVGFDDLWRREKRREKKRRIIQVSIISSLFIIISTLSIFSLFQWKKSEHQKQIAIEGREAAEGLIEHTLFDLRDKLEPIGKLDILYSTFKAVDVYYDKLGTSNASSDILFRVSAYHANSGSYFKNIGNLSEAKKHFNKAREIMKKLVHQSPSDSLLQRNYAVIHSELGNIMETVGQHEKANEYIQIAHEILEKEALLNPSNHQLQSELAKSYGKLGNIQRHYKKPKEVKKKFNMALNMMQRLVNEDSNNHQWQNDKSVIHTTYGVYLQFLDKPKKALEQFEISLEMRKKLVDKYPEDYSYKHSLSESYKYIGSIYLLDPGKLKEAEKSFEVARDIMYELVEHDLTNTQWRHSLARSHHKMGDLQLYLEKKDNAVEHYNKSIKIIHKLISDDPYNLSLQQEASLESSKLGNIYLELKNPEIAKTHLENALDTMQKLVKADPSNFTYQYTLAIVYDDLSSLYRHQYGEVDIYNFYTNIEKIQQKNKEFEKGLKYSKESLKILQKLKEDDPINPLWNVNSDDILKLGNILRDI